MNKNLLIIGASRGIGAVLASKLAESNHLFCASRTPTDFGEHIEWDAAGGRDLPKDSLPKELHGLVYCPGSINLKPFSRLDDASFQQDWELNFLGAVRAIRAALPALRKSGQASVVLFSTVAVQTGMSMHASISAAKGAVEGLTRALAAEYAPKIRCNAIAPSLTDTPLAAELLKDDARRAAANARHPMARITSADEVADLASYLLSDSSASMTGQVIQLDGGIGSLRLLK